MLSRNGFRPRRDAMCTFRTFAPDTDTDTATNKFGSSTIFRQILTSAKTTYDLAYDELLIDKLQEY